jgi:hypothetical protein
MVEDYTARRLKIIAIFFIDHKNHFFIVGKRRLTFCFSIYFGLFQRRSEKGDKEGDKPSFIGPLFFFGSFAKS